MQTPTHITDPADPRLADFANLKDAQLRDAEFRGERGRFIAESELVVRALAASDFPVVSLLVEDTHFPRLRDLELPQEAQVFTAPRGVMAEIAGFAFHRGVLACGLRRAPKAWREVAAGASVLVIGEGIANADNIGAIFRNTACLAGGVGAVLLTRTCCDPLYRKSLRVSIGHALRVPWSYIEPWPGCLAELEAMGFLAVALTPGKGAVDIRAMKAPARVALIVGAEGPGLTDAAIEGAGVAAKIPMSPGADSLNVATALAVALSWMQRDRVP